MEESKLGRIEEPGMPDVVLSLVITYINDPRDRDAVSMVCRRWYDLDSQTRKNITIALCYSTTPEKLLKRFPHVEFLKLKGKPRAAMFNLIPDDWGGFAEPWIRLISDPSSFPCLRSLHFRRMILRDSDLQLLAFRGRVLHGIHLDKCSGFSTDGLLHVARHCRQLRTLFMEECQIEECDGEWLHELAMNNTVLEVLNFYMTNLTEVNPEDLELIARNCPSLSSVKISDCELLDLANFFRYASSLSEFCGGSFNETPDQPDRYSSFTLPTNLSRVGLTYLNNNGFSLLSHITSNLVKLDLLFALLDTEDHCLLIQRCPNLEILETRNVIGDRGLEVLAIHCKRLKRLRIERGEDEQEMEDEEGLVSQRGLIALSEGCIELEYMAVYVSDISNSAFEHIGARLKNLNDFRMVLLDREERITDLPLDNGVRALLQGCDKLTRFALYLRPGGLTDVGLGYIGQCSTKVLWMLLGYVGDSDEGLMAFARGCPSLVKLEIRGCCFSEGALARAVLALPSLRYLWVQGYRGSTNGSDLVEMVRPYWNIELIPGVPIPNQLGEMVWMEQPGHILAYYSLAGVRTDFPEYIRFAQ